MANAGVPDCCNECRSKEEVRDLATEAGMTLADAEFDRLWAMATEADGAGDRACLDTFFRARQHVLEQTLEVPPPF